MPYKLVHSAEANETHTPRRLQRVGTRFIQRNHIFQHDPVHAVSSRLVSGVPKLIALPPHRFRDRAILEAMPQLDIQLAPQNDARRNIVLSLPGQIETNYLPRDVADAIRGLWRDPGVKEAVRRSREFQLNDSAV